MSYQQPFLTLWGANDPGQLGSCETQQRLIDSVPGAQGQPHDRLPEASHFLQTDQGKACCELKGQVPHDEETLGSGVGAGIRKEEAALREKVNAAIAALAKAGYRNDSL